ncbi:hypothetical protein [Nitrogeniibacter aestuarii]|uniref:hypothetical protein n=1 Tax=Nitrogeniibacter aestuarii TaxID=2815343 RepID=UPI001D12AE96|nr:hypothetical protein [Nitrogeniibacter aestuarii]
MRRFCLAIAAASLTACSTIDALPGPGEGASTQWLLIPAAGLTAMQTGMLTVPNITAAVSVWALYDPLAPNWDIRAAQLDERRIRFSMKHKFLHSGGAGEANQVLKRNAERFALEQGFSEYEIVSFEEGIESTRPFARRFAVAEVVMLRGRALPGL